MAKVTAEQIDAMINEYSIPKAKISKRNRPVKAVRMRSDKAAVDPTEKAPEVDIVDVQVKNVSEPALAPAPVKEPKVEDTAENAASFTEKVEEAKTSTIQEPQEKEVSMSTPTIPPEPSNQAKEAGAVSETASIQEATTEPSGTPTAADPADVKGMEVKDLPSIEVNKSIFSGLTDDMDSSWKAVLSDLVKVFSNGHYSNGHYARLRNSAVAVMADSKAPEIARRLSVPGSLRALYKAMPLDADFSVEDGCHNLTLRLKKFNITFIAGHGEDGIVLTLFVHGDVSEVKSLANKPAAVTSLEGVSVDEFVTVLAEVKKLHNAEVVTKVTLASQAKP